MKAYKITPIGTNIFAGVVPKEIYVLDFNTIEKLRQFFKDITPGEDPFEWEIEEIDILSDKEIAYQIMDGFNEIFSKNQLEEIKRNE